MYWFDLFDVFIVASLLTLLGVTVYLNGKLKFSLSKSLAFAFLSLIALNALGFVMLIFRTGMNQDMGSVILFYWILLLSAFYALIALICFLINARKKVPPA